MCRPQTCGVYCLTHESGGSRVALEPPNPQSPDNDDAGIIRCGSHADYVSLKVAQGILWVILEGEPRGDDLRLCFERALATGTITTSMRTFVDMLRFTGSVDWPSIHAIKDMAVWGADGQARTAYLTRDTMAVMLLRALVDFFPLTRHRFFADREQALLWLRA